MEDAPSGSASFSGLHTDTPHAFVRIDRRAEIRSDFDHTNRVTLEDAEPGRPPYEQARAVRDERTGRILLPVLGEKNIPRDCRMPVHIRPLEPRPQQNDTLRLQFEHDADQRRVLGHRRVEETWRRVLGPDSDHEQIAVPAGWTGEDLRMCAVTLAGDPRRPSPVDRSQPPTAPPDSPYNELHPGEVWVRLQHRPPEGSSWWQPNDLALFQIAPLLLQSNLEPARRLHVVAMPHNHNALYEIMEACWTAFGAPGDFNRDFDCLLPTSTPEERRAAVDNGDVATQDLNEEDERPQPVLSPNKMYIINGNTYPDSWIQDQMAIGYCSAPGNRTLNVVLHCKRSLHLRSFVKREMQHPEDRVFVFNGIAEWSAEAQDPTNSGGNIAVSPPVRTNTTATGDYRAGPPVPKHPPAPHGKIILGDCHNPHRTETMGDPETGTVHAETRTFLQSQQVQPIVPIDTSWLAVGHVDEIMTFVPGADGPKLAMARPDVMNTLLKETQRIAVRNGRTHLHRGRHRAHYRYLDRFFDSKRVENGDDRYPEAYARELNQQRGTLGDPEHILAGSYDETSIETLYREEYQTNQTICTQLLDPIEHRLCHCTGLNRRTDVLPLPVYFSESLPTRNGAPWGEKLAEARTPNVVNMQVLNTEQDTHLLVADPCGPRLPRPEARKVVRSVLDKHRQTTTVQLPQDQKDGKRGFQFWAWPFLKIQTLALFFTRVKPDGRGSRVFLTPDEREQMINVIRQNRPIDTLREDLQQAVHHTKETILEANPELVSLIDDRGRLADQWHRLLIPEDTVDVVKAYTQSVLGRAGRTVHFVDAWFYHSGGGGVHCGTNVLRSPPAPDSPEQPERPPWWHAYPDLADANTAYNPTQTSH